MKIINVLMLSSVITLVSCGKNAGVAEQEINQEVIEVSLSKSFSDDRQNDNQILINGKFESYKSSNLSSRLMGNVQQVLVREGQSVKKGQVLVSIKATDLETKKAGLEAMLKEVNSSYSLAQKNNLRYKALFEEQSATEFEYDQAKLNLESAKSKVVQIQQSLAELNILINESIVRSPFDGTVTGVFTETGSMATYGMPLVKIETSDKLILKALVAESQIQFIDKNQEVTIQLQHSGERCKGKIQNINPSSSASGSQYEIEILPDPSKLSAAPWKSGMYASAYLKMIPDTTAKLITEKSIIIPKKALFERGQLTGIYTVNEQNKALLRWVRLGKDYGDRIEVLSGLTAEEQFITEADNRLYNGATVRIKQ